MIDIRRSNNIKLPEATSDDKIYGAKFQQVLKWLF
jgi:hypothetical protein